MKPENAMQTGSGDPLRERAPGLRRALEGVLLGTAVGDALGFPAENLSPTRIRRRWKGQWRMRFVLDRGMISDDTEHTLMVAQALLAHCDDAAAFQRALAWKFRWWFAGLPGGMSLDTAKACLKLWMGVPASGPESFRGTSCSWRLFSCTDSGACYLHTSVQKSTLPINCSM